MSLKSALSRSAFAGILLLASPVAAGSAQPSAAPLVPSGQWVIEGQDNMCAVSHAYGEGASRVTLTVRPWPIGDSVDILLFYPSNDRTPDHGSGTVELDPPGGSFAGVYTAYALKGRNQRLASLAGAPLSRDLLENARTITLAFGKSKPVTITQPITKAAYATLRQCGDMLLRSLNIDPAAVKAVVTPPEPASNVAGWFRTSDYPETALAGNAQGATAMLLTIGLDGRITTCVPFGRSGNLAIDKAACTAITQRGRYKPGLDASGKPVVSYTTQRVRWLTGF